MPIYNFKCHDCGREVERIVNHDIYSIDCTCGNFSIRQFSPPGRHDGNIEDPAWLRSVLAVVDKNPHKPHCQEFLQNPTRENYKKWMAKEGIRHLEDGEKPQRRDEDAAIQRMGHEMFMKHRARKRIEVRGF